MRKASVLSAFLCGLSLLFLAATPASADPNAPGNNGTIKIHESPGEREPAMANDPHEQTSAPGRLSELGRR